MTQLVVLYASHPHLILRRITSTLSEEICTCSALATPQTQQEFVQFRRLRRVEATICGKIMGVPRVHAAIVDFCHREFPLEQKIRTELGEQKVSPLRVVHKTQRAERVIEAVHQPNVGSCHRVYVGRWHVAKAVVFDERHLWARLHLGLFGQALAR